jgi:hypothetical protein
MTTEPPTTPRPRRRWLRFSLQTMMVLVLAINVRPSQSFGPA